MAAKPKEFSSSVVNYIPKIKPPEGHSIHHICCPHDCPGQSHCGCKDIGQPAAPKLFCRHRWK